MKKTMLLLVALLFAGAQMLSAQRTITGTVISADDNLGIPGATVTVRGTTTGTSTDINGRFSLSVPTGATHLVFAFMGMETQEVEIGARTTIDVTLTSGAIGLDEFVVTGFGTVRRSAFTGTATAVSGEALASRTTSNVMNALEGNVAGIQMTSAGQPGTSGEIRIRGRGSISAGNNPLIIMDGVTFEGELSSINPDDIESITVLKDAASASMFGSRAANGVILITTKTGRNQAGFNVRFSQGFSSRSIQEYERVGPMEYYQLFWQSRRNTQMGAFVPATGLFWNPALEAAAGLNASNNLIADLGGFNITNVENNQIILPDGTINPNAFIPGTIANDLDWFAPLTRLGRRTELSVAASAATEDSDVRASFAFVDEEGYLIYSGFQRFSGRVNMNHRVNEWFRTTLNVHASTSTMQFTNDEGSASFVNPFFAARNMGAIFPVHAHELSTGTRLRNLAGEYFFDLNPGLGNSTRNGVPVAGRPMGGNRHVIAETMWNSRFQDRHAFGGLTSFTLQPVPWLSFTANTSYDLNLLTTQVGENAIIGDGAPQGRANTLRTSIETVTAQQLINFNRSFGRHTLDVVAGHEFYIWNRTELYAMRATEIVPNNPNLSNYVTTLSLTGFEDAYRLQSFLLRANYSFMDRYAFSASIRRDGSSRFHPDNRWGNFWSVGAGWRIDQEQFMSNVTWLHLLRLRASYGQVGNDAGISLYAFQPIFLISALAGTGTNNADFPGVRQTSFGAPDLVWESNNSFDIGLEFGFRWGLRGDLVFFNRQSENLLFNVRLPGQAGLPSSNRLENIGTMRNRGFEIELAYDFRAGDFTWTPSINISHTQNKITRMAFEGQAITTGHFRWAAGHSIYDIFTREFRGVDPRDGRALYTWNTGEFTDRVAPTAQNHRVIEGDTFALAGAAAEMTYTGHNAMPTLIGGFTNTFTWRGFDLSILTTFQLGGYVFDNTYQNMFNANSGTGGALHIDAANAWSHPGHETNVPRLGSAFHNDHVIASTRWLTSGSFLSIRAINFGYNIPREWANRIHLSSARVFFSAENLAMFSHRQGLNPQQTFSGLVSNAEGFIPARLITVGVNLNF
ncbi:MAG: SusC/RagA family TonB-linked outer membrane protein [Bacteroidales bacterium]|nr:SusC/RagA family TonB-linked outer membrane protein [Bacteroidales bacterium]